MSYLKRIKRLTPQLLTGAVIVLLQATASAAGEQEAPDLNPQPIEDYQTFLRLSYAAYMNNSNVAEMTIEMSRSDSRYYVEMRTQTKGFYDTILRWKSHYYSQGVVSGDVLVPELFIAHSSGTFAGQQFTRISFEEGAVVSWESRHKDIDGSLSDENRELLSEAIDPMAMFMQIVLDSSEQTDCQLRRNKTFNARVAATFHFERIEDRRPKFVENAIYLPDQAIRCEMWVDSSIQVNKNDRNEWEGREKPENPILFFQDIGERYPVLPIAVHFPVTFGQMSIFLVGAKIISSGEN